MRAVEDPIRRAWESGDFLSCSTLLQSGLEPKASTLRRVLAPKNFWRVLSAPGTYLTRDGTTRLGIQDFFSQALLNLCAKAPSVLQKRPDILADMRLNASWRLVANALIERPKRMLPAERGGALQDLSAQALLAVLSLVPKAPHQPALSCSWRGPREELAIEAQSEPLWARALKLPEPLARILLDHARTRAPLDARVAWRALISGLSYLRHPGSAELLAREAQAPGSSEFALGCRDVALAFMARPNALPAEPWLSLLARMCERNAALLSSMGPEVFLGSDTSLSTDPSSFKFSLDIRLRPFASRHASDSERERALALLDWLEGAALLAARFGLPDLLPLPHKRLEQAYASLFASLFSFEPSACNAMAHPFVSGHRSIEAAFNARKLFHHLELFTPKNNLPSSRKSL